jgi:ferric-dicitrate binding protein FerR (iron transport regulator)
MVSMKSENEIWPLIAGHLNQELSEEESSLLKTLIQDQGQEKLFQRMKAIHSALNEMKQMHRFRKDASWNKIGFHIHQIKIRKRIVEFLTYAAVLVIVFFAGNLLQPSQPGQRVPAQYTKVDVNYGQTSHLILFDGTEVWLNSGTTFRYPDRFNSSERKVYLEGEAYFKVAPNKKLPFKVHTGQMEIEALGTSFNVSAFPDDSIHTVVLVEGSVQINNPEGKKIEKMLPGQIAFQNPGRNIRIEQVSTSVYTTWKDGILNFREERLEDIAKKLERWYNLEISFENENLKKYLITGTVLRDKPIDQITQILEMIAPVRFEYLIKTDRKSRLIVKQRKEG